MLRQSDGTRKRTSPTSRSGLITITVPPRRRSATSCVMRRGMVRRRVGADHERQVGLLEIVERHRRRAAADRVGERHARRLVAVVRAVVDVVGAVDAREALQQECRLVAAPARGVEERAIGRRGPQRGGGDRQRLVPADATKVAIAVAAEQREADAPGRFELARRQARERRRDRAPGRSPRRSAAACRPPAPGSTSCRPPGRSRARSHAAHADRAGLAGIVAAQAPRERDQSARLPGARQGVAHGGQAASGASRAHRREP